jgi:WhiB family redox-sensing transcriptional regulator
MGNAAYLQVSRMIHGRSYPWESWMNRGDCHGLETSIFFPETKAGLVAPLAICAQCPVRTDCLRYALRHNIGEGVWGGYSERGRRRLRASKEALGV